ncbi:BZ3500_MvSof-1268-A1-R1_Chr11-1g03221 [Microbotryum saponariae]|uniref:BZ3500_MvSof-1268-A1-R1_Chr11-1g03221 protein n=1 Tax=Microbotryum saponariae TaxID=289078 RepID=A0A2X0LA74_9BASI|nr:BZ3501_MvSof-1269-A2-R1_Chr11g02796 [Microbotryum saponariae]SDA03781.1 BZ3500_MvSof-1268-A1-R1_Chr11-1g03221 [Microbotryum saponariae]
MNVHAASLNIHADSEASSTARSFTASGGAQAPSASAFQSGTPAALRRRTDRESSADSSSSEELISYGDNTAAEEPVAAGNIIHGVRTTRQKVDRRPLSDWHLKPFREMTWAERLCKLAAAPEQVHELVPETVDRGPMPTNPWWNDNIFIISRAMIAPVIQHTTQSYFNITWNPVAAYFFYVFIFIEFARMVLDRLNGFSIRFGSLDEKNCGRDRTPNASVNNLALGVVAYMFIRPLFTFLLAYDKTQQPLDIIRWSYPLRLMAWQLTLDYLFYCYHRLTHEVDGLWWVHKHHHSTRHPTAILSILAEDYQEVLEIFILPFLASLLWRQTFTEQWITLCYTLMVEMQGHSGVRMLWHHPTLFWLKYFNCGLVLEDHDLHHRMGRSGRNYGKQSRVWDRLFGTSTERIETYGMF